MLQRRLLLTVVLASLATIATAQPIDRGLSEAFYWVEVELNPNRNYADVNTPVVINAYLQNYDGPLRSRAGIMRVRVWSEATNSYVAGAITPSTTTLASLGPGERSKPLTFTIKGLPEGNYLIAAEYLVRAIQPWPAYVLKSTATEPLQVAPFIH